MRDKIKKCICFIFSVFFISNIPLNVMASNENNDGFNAQEFVSGYLEKINEHDWEALADYYTSDKTIEVYDFVTNSQNLQEHKGILNVNHAEAIEIIDVDFSDAQYLLVEDYTGKKAKTFIVGTEYSTYKDTEFYANGICYDLYSVVLENTGWKIYEKRTVWDFEGLIEKGYHFNNQYKATEEVIAARRNGVILNYNGEFVETFFDEVPFLTNDEGTIIAPQATSVTSYSIPTESTQIVYYNKTYNLYITKGFHTMCKAITYAECGSDATFGNYPEARKAIIMAIKTYVWHFYIIQSSKDTAYHINSDQIAYNDNYKSTYGFLTDYSAVQNIWMQGTSSAGNAIIFEANFKQGSSTTSQTSFKHGGELKQLGCIYLLNHDSTVNNYKDLLHYYYDYSPRSQGGAVQFFNAQKNFI